MEFDLNTSGHPLRVKVDEATKIISLARYLEHDQQINVMALVELNEDEFKKLIKWAQSYFDKDGNTMPVR
jgi:uncharacterized Fe-S cluster-containing radical SAM superfamily enzyme